MQKNKIPLLPILLIGSLFFLTSCLVNPVTGKRELGVVTQDQEIAIGTEQYGPTQQIQGGTYSVDLGLEHYVQRVGHRIAEVSGVYLPYEFVVVNNSTPNAWALPGGKIAINRGLLMELQSEAELAAVLAHEIAHSAARHGARRIERGMLLQGGLLAASIASKKSEYGRLVVGGAQLGSQLIQQKYSREAEFEADQYGMQFMSNAGYDPGAAVDLQKTFVRLSNNREKNWLSGLFSTHPPSQERVKRNQKKLDSMQITAQIGTITGVQQYQDAISYIDQKKPAYEKYAKARQAFTNGDLLEAEETINEAIKIEDEDSIFHTLRGDIRFERGEFAASVSDYDRAIQLSDHFASFLGRGLARIRLKETLPAKTDFLKSVGLLPTSEALYELGKISEQDGEFDVALDYYRNAASSESVSGREATRAAVRIDLARNPDDFVSVRVEGIAPNIVVGITNLTPFDMSNVVVAVDVIQSNLKKNQYRIDLLRLDRNTTAFRTLAADSGIFVQNVTMKVESAQLQRM